MPREGDTMPINYRLREDVQALILCLYNPSGASFETQYTFSSLSDYIQDCACQLERGEKIKRFPFHLAPCRADALQAQENFRRIISSMRKERTTESGIVDDDPTSTDTTGKRFILPVRASNRADHAFVRRKA